MNTTKAVAAWRRRTHARSLGDGPYRLVAGKPGIKLAIAHQPAATPSRRTAGDARPTTPPCRENYAPSVDPQHKCGEDGAASLGGGGVTSAWQPIETAPKNRPIVLAGQWDGFGQSGEWDIQIGTWLINRFPFIGNNAPTHWMPLPEPPLAP